MSDVVRDPRSGKALEQEDPPDGHVWRNPATGQRFIRSPISGAVVKCGSEPGKKGHHKGGPKPKEFKEFSNDALKDPATHAKLIGIAHGEDDAEALRAINTMAKYSQELPKQTTEHHEHVTILVGGAPLGFERQIPEVEYEEVTDVEQESETERPTLPAPEPESDHDAGTPPDPPDAPGRERSDPRPRYGSALRGDDE